MKLHRLRLTNFKGVAQREITFPDRGVVIVQGANEAGKTTMVEALDLLFEVKDNSTKQEVKDAKPVGADVGAEVEAEISTANHRFVYRKRWHKDRLTELQIISPRREQLSGVAAHERVEQILRADVDVELFKALRVLQGALPQQLQLAGNTALTGALDAAAGVISDGGQSETLVEAIEAEYRKYFTAKGRPTGPYAAAETELANRQAEVAAAQLSLAEAVEDVERYEAQLAQQAELEEQLRQAKVEHDELDEQWQLVAELRRAVAELTDASARCEAEVELARNAVTQRVSLAAEVKDRDATVAQLRTEIADEPADVARGLADREKRLTAAKVAASEAETALAEAQQLVAYLRDAAELTRARATLANIAAAEQRRDTAQQQLAGARITAELLAKIEAAELEFERARAQEHAAAATINFAALGDVALDVAGEVQELTAGGQIDHVITEPFRAQINDLLVINVSPALDSGALASARSAAQEQLAQLLQQAQTSSVATARASLAERVRAEQLVEQANGELAAHLGDETLSDLRQREAHLAVRCEQYLAKVGATAQIPDDEAAAEQAVSELVQSAQAARTELARAQADIEGYRQVVTDQAAKRAGLASRLAAAIEERERAQQLLATEREGISDDDLAERETDARARLAAVEADLEAKSAQLEAAVPPGLELRWENARAKVERFTAQLAQCSQQLTHLAGRLEAIGTEGRAEVLSTAQTALEAADQNHKQLADLAAGAALLRDTVQRHRASAQARYVAPFRQRVTELAQLVFGADLELQVEPDLTIASRTLRGRTVPYELLSSGAQEQLALLSRLACAALVAPGAGVPVIIDDALGYSDPQRLDRLGAAFTAVANEAQIVVLTCSPRRYEAVGAATVVTLD